MMSGFFLSYIFLKKKYNSASVYPLAIIQRILRIWPAFFFSITFFSFVFIHISNGPLWGLIHAYVSNCSHFWRSFLFVGNLMDNGDAMCMGWSWYLQADIQLFIVCIFLLYLFKKSKPLYYLLIGLMIAGSSLYLFILCQENGFQIYWNEQNFPQMMKYVLGAYLKPWSRCSGYLIGLIFGQKYSEYKGNHTFI